MKLTAMQFTYTNWKGETRVRCVWPIRIFVGSNQWHPKEQWLMEAIDLERFENGECWLNAIRFFAMAEMREIKSVERPVSGTLYGERTEVAR